MRRIKDSSEKEKMTQWYQVKADIVLIKVLCTTASISYSAADFLSVGTLWGNSKVTSTQHTCTIRPVKIKKNKKIKALASSTILGYRSVYRVFQIRRPFTSLGNIEDNWRKPKILFKSLGEVYKNRKEQQIEKSACPVMYRSMRMTGCYKHLKGLYL